MKFDCRSSIRFFSTLAMLNLALISVAQDIHFSQFNHSPANLNPALTGVFAGDLRFVANYRSQWKAVPVAYRTVSATFDSRLFHKALGKNGYLGYGMNFNNDAAGDAQIGISQLAANLAFTRRVTDALFLSVGTQFSLGQRSINPQNLSYEEQWNGDVYDPSSPNGESFTTTSKAIGSVSSGLNLHYQAEDSRTRLDGGIGIFHLNQPNTSFEGNPKVDLNRKSTVYLLSILELSTRLDLLANGQFSRQLTYQEVAASVAVQYHFNQEKNSELSAQLGFGYRIGDALIPTAGLRYHNWTAGFTYDQNISNFKVATNRRGGPEFFLQYILWRVHPPKEHKACPIF